MESIGIKEDSTVEHIERKHIDEMAHDPLPWMQRKLKEKAALDCYNERTLILAAESLTRLVINLTEGHNHLYPRFINPYVIPVPQTHTKMDGAHLKTSGSSTRLNHVTLRFILSFF